jgi:hypothetical protein
MVKVDSGGGLRTGGPEGREAEMTEQEKRPDEDVEGQTRRRVRPDEPEDDAEGQAARKVGPGQPEDDVEGHTKPQLGEEDDVEGHGGGKVRR